MHEGFHPLHERGLGMAAGAAHLHVGRSVASHASLGQPRLADTQKGRCVAGREQAVHPVGGALLSHGGPLVWDVSPKPIGTTVKRRKLPGGFLQKSSARATPWAIPMGAAHPTRFAPAVDEAILGYVKS